MALPITLRDELIDELLGSAKTTDNLFGQEGLLKVLSKQLMECLLDAEMSNHLGYLKHAVEGYHSDNLSNGKTRKVVKTGNGEIEIAVPRDRESEFNPIIIGKHQSRLAGLDSTVLSLYAKGMTVRDIQAHLQDLCGTEISTDLISTMTDAVLEDVTA